MNYLKIYKQIVEKAKSENRRKKNGIYYERHHIVPDFMFIERKRKGPKGHLPGDPDNPKNLVLLTAREHILCHVLLAKALYGKRYSHQAASALTFFYTKVMGNHPRQKNNLPGLMRKYKRYRELGLSGISKARQGKMPVVDAITRESIGSVPVDHPKVLSGEWIHHSKGIKITDPKRLEKFSKASSGTNNARCFTDVTNEFILKTYIWLSKRVGGIPSLNFYRKWVEIHFNKKIPLSFTKYRFNEGKDLFPLIENATGFKFKKHDKWSRKLSAESIKYIEGF
jgi:hypothetical protein